MMTRTCETCSYWDASVCYLGPNRIRAPKTWFCSAWTETQEGETRPKPSPFKDKEDERTAVFD